MVKPEYAQTLASMGGAAALLVTRKVQALLRSALLETFPEQKQPELIESYIW